MIVFISIFAGPIKAFRYARQMVVSALAGNKKNRPFADGFQNTSKGTTLSKYSGFSGIGDWIQS